MGQDVEQLVEVARVLGEEVAVAAHEPLEVGLFAGSTVGQHLVELGHHVLEALHVLRAHVPEGGRHL